MADTLDNQLQIEEFEEEPKVIEQNDQEEPQSSTEEVRSFEGGSPDRKGGRPSSAAPTDIKAKAFTPVRGSKLNPFDSPEPTSKSKAARPKTAKKDTGVKSSFASSPMYKTLAPSPSKKGKKPKPQNMLSLVAKKDRLQSQHVIAYLKMLLDTATRVKDPGDDIIEIFNKITFWK